jgi:uncharacterized membrane protein (Fun14 family)
MVVENYLFSAAGWFLLGAISGYALKRIIRIAAVIIGAFFLGLIFLAYRGWIQPEWNVIQSQTYNGIMNASQTAQQYLQSTANHLTSNVDGQDLMVTAGVGFLPGLIIGLRH